MLQEKKWLEFKWDKNYTVLIEKTLENNETWTQFWLRKQNYGVIDHMFGVPGNLNETEIKDYIERNIYQHIYFYEQQYN